MESVHRQKFAYTLIFVLLLSSQVTFSQDYYWVGNSGNWSDISHWATTSGGSTIQTVPPTASNNVIFDVNSFSAAGQTVTIDDPLSACLSIDWTGVTNTPTLDIASDLSIDGSLTLDAGLIITGNGTIRFTSSGTGNSITTAGLSPRNISFEGSGDWTLQDDLNSISSITLDEGTLATNNHSVSCSYFYFSDGTSARQLNLGSSTLSINYWDVSVNTNLILDAGTSTITITSTFVGGDLTYYNVLLDALSIGVNGSNTYETLTVASGTIVHFEEGKTQTTNDLQATGDCGNIILLKSTSDGIAANIVQTSGTVNLDYVELKDMAASGGATFNVTNGIDDGNNSGWNITALTGTNYYWVGDGGNWSDAAHWSLSSGGSSSGCLPTLYDNVFFDANSFTTADQVVTIDDLNAKCLSMDWTGVTNTPDLGGSRDLSIYGSLTLVSPMTVSYTGFDLTFRSDNTGNTVTTAGHSFSSYIHFDGSGEWTLQDDIVFATRVYLDEGSLITNGKEITTTNFYLTTESTRQLTLGNSTITCGTQWNLFDETNLTFDAGTSTIIVGSSGTFYGADQTYYDVQMTSSQQINILGSNTFNHLSITNSEDIKLSQGTTQTMNEFSILAGSCTDFATISSDNVGFPATISMPLTSTMNADYIIITDVMATGGGVFNATNSIGVGDVTGWNISANPGQDFYWVGGTGGWDEPEHWSLTSGGSPGTCTPSLLDNVHFDDNSFTAEGQFVHLNGTNYCKTLDWTSALFTPEIGGSGKLMINGSIIFISEMIVDFEGSYTFLSPDPGNAIQTAGHSLSSPFNFDGTGGYTLQDDLNTTGHFNYRQGDFDTNGYDVSLGGDFNAYYGLPRDLSLSSSILTTGNWNIADPTNLVFEAGTSQIILATNSDNFAGADLSYHDVFLKGPNAVSFTGSNTLNILTLEAGVTLSLEESITQTVTRLLARGTEELPVALHSNSSGNVATISQATPNFCGDYLNIQDMVATGGAPFFAGENSTDLGNNTGWSFTNCVRPVVDAGADIAICIGETTDIGGSPTASGATAPYTYSWTPADGLSDVEAANPMASPTDTTTYIVTVTDNLSAQNADTITIFVKPLPLIDASPDTTICIGASVQLNASGGVSYAWSPSISLDDSSISNPIATPSSTTTYTVVATDADGCSSSADVTVIVDPAVTANAGTDVSICIGESTMLNGSGGLTYAWSPKTGLSDTTIANPIANPIVTTTYTLTTTSGACSDTDMVTVTVNELPVADAGTDDFVCFGDTLVIGGSSTGSAGTPPYTYSWTPGGSLNNASIANPMAFPQTNTIYEVTVTDANGCTSTNDVTIFVNFSPVVNAGADITVCPSSQVTLGGSPTTSGSAPPFTYSWAPSNLVSDPTQANPSASPTATSDYIVTVTDANGCQNADTVRVIVVDVMPQASFTYIESAARMYTFTDTSLEHSEWLWDFGDGSTSVLQNPIHTYGENGTYDVCLTVSDDCYEDVFCETITVLVLGTNSTDTGMEVYPNPAFDMFQLRINDHDFDAEIRIYSISGHIVYSRTVKKVRSSDEFKINIVDWPDGIYAVVVTNGASTTTNRLVIKKN